MFFFAYIGIKSRGVVNLLVEKRKRQFGQSRVKGEDVRIHKSMVRGEEQREEGNDMMQERE